MSSISSVMIGKYERNEAVPSIDVAKKIADAFGVSLDYLVGPWLNFYQFFLILFPSLSLWFLFTPTLLPQFYFRFGFI